MQTEFDPSPGMHFFFEILNSKGNTEKDGILKCLKKYIQMPVR